MATITFTGSNKSGYVEYYGIRFPCGEPVETDDKDAIKMAKGHPEFKVSSKADPLADDEEPKRKPGRSRKA